VELSVGSDPGVGPVPGAPHPHPPEGGAPARRVTQRREGSAGRSTAPRRDA
jgi:hypothetical protein